MDQVTHAHCSKSPVSVVELISPKIPKKYDNYTKEELVDILKNKSGFDSNDINALLDKNGDGKPIELEYIVEALDPMHRISKFVEWVNYGIQGTYVNYMELIPPKAPIQPKTFHEGTAREITIQSSGFVKYFTPEFAENYLITLDNGVVKYARELDRVECHHYNYIIDAKTREMYVFPQMRYCIHHSSINHGRPVLCAGMINVSNNGHITMNLDSGHYKCGLEQFRELLSYIPDFFFINQNIKFDNTRDDREEQVFSREDMIDAVKHRLSKISDASLNANDFVGDINKKEDHTSRERQCPSPTPGRKLFPSHFCDVGTLVAPSPFGACTCP